VNTDYAVGAAIACAICNAVAAILQKVGSDKVTTIESYSPKILLRLAEQTPYVIGLILDVLAGVFTLVAVNRLPLFLVQALIASSVLLTALLEHVFLKRKLSVEIYAASLAGLVGLGLLAMASHPEATASVSVVIRYSVVGLPAVLATLGGLAVRSKSKYAAVSLATLSGTCFGFVSVVGRLLVYPSPIWLIAKNPLAWALIAYGALGMFFFTAALQRTHATITNGIMLSTQTIVPILLGIAVLGDTPRHGLWAILWLGCLLVVGSCIFIASTE